MEVKPEITVEVPEVQNDDTNPKPDEVTQEQPKSKSKRPWRPIHMIRRKKMYGTKDKQLETGRERTKRLKKRREAYLRRKANETPEQKQARKERKREAYRLKQLRNAQNYELEANQILENGSEESEHDYGDHPAIDFDKYCVFSDEELEPCTKDSIEESTDEDEENEISTGDTIKLNKYKIKCLDIQKEIDKVEYLLEMENQRRQKLESDITELGITARKLEEDYGIPIMCNFE